MSIAENIQNIRSQLPAHVTLVAVSKTKPVSYIEEALGAGQLDFGENKVQELTSKYETLPREIRWHFIGHLQTNKVKYIAPFVEWIHAVDSLKLLKTIDKEAGKSNRNINCLLQMHIAEEQTKFGLSRSEIVSLLDSSEYKELKWVKVCGLMGMATYTNDESKIRKEFGEIRQLFEELKSGALVDNSIFTQLSIGMSGDYNVAVEEGSTMVRVGTAIFGERNYSRQ